jgi:hypothetical protein
MVKAPVIEKKTIKFNIDFVFDHCPQEYWLFYDHKTERLVIEFFGVHIESPSVEIKGTSIISDLKVKNKTTDLALNGKNSQISMVMKKEWHYESSILKGRRVLRLQLWMPLNPNKGLGRKKNFYRIPILVTSLSLLITLYVILLDQTNR